MYNKIIINPNTDMSHIARFHKMDRHRKKSSALGSITALVCVTPAKQ